MDTTFLLEPWEENYFDDDGNFIEDPETEAEIKKWEVEQKEGVRK